MKSVLRIFLVALPWALFLAHPGSATETVPNCRAPLQISGAAGAEAPDLSQIFEAEPAPRWLAIVSCDQCAIPQGPGFQCNKQCRALGLCTDQCYADSGTCQLVGCVCTSC